MNICVIYLAPVFRLIFSMTSLCVLMTVVLVVSLMNGNGDHSIIIPSFTQLHIL